jgi:hypothetical protein
MGRLIKALAAIGIAALMVPIWAQTFDVGSHGSRTFGPGTFEVWVFAGGGGGQGGGSHLFRSHTGGGGGSGSAVYMRFSSTNSVTISNITVGGGGGSGNGRANQNNGHDGQPGSTSQITIGSTVFTATGGGGGHGSRSGGSGGTATPATSPSISGITWLSYSRLNGNDGGAGRLDGNSGNNGGSAITTNGRSAGGGGRGGYCQQWAGAINSANGGNGQIVIVHTPIHTLTIDRNPTAGGTVVGGGTFNSGVNATITATPNAGYAFSGWTPIAGIANPNSATTTVSMTQNRTLTANFTLILPTNLSLGVTTNLQITAGQRREVRFTPSLTARYRFETVSNNGLDPVPFITATGGDLYHLGTGAAYWFERDLTANQTFTFWSGVWQNNSSANGTYTIRVVLLAPTINTSPANRTASVGQTAQFTVAATGAQTFQWQISTNNGSSWSNVTTAHGTGGTTAAFTTVATTTAMSGNFYRVLATNSAGSATSNSAMLTVTSPPAITSQPINRTVTTNQTAQFSVVATGSPTLTYQWEISTNGGSTWSNVTATHGTGGTTANFTTVATTAAMNNNRYRVRVTNGFGNVTSSAVILTVNRIAGATASAPIMASRTFNSVTLNASTLSPNNTGQTIEYAFNTTNTPPVTGWTTNRTFSSLNGCVNYFFFARAAESATHLQGANSAGTLVAAVHSYGELITTIAATCTGYGESARVCSNCGNKTDVQILSPLGHNWSNWVITTPATYEANGVETRTCLRSCCINHTETREISSPTHDFGAWQTTIAATCTTEGEETRTCGNCGLEESRVILELGHNMSEWTTIVPETCLTDREEERVCSRNGCDHIEERIVSETSLGHDMPNEWSVKTAETCLTDREEQKICRRDNCGHYEEQTVLETALGHAWIDNWTTTVQPTCMVEGEERRVCTRAECEHAQTRQIAINENAHDWGSWQITLLPTCETEGVLSRICRHNEEHTEIIPIGETGHDWVPTKRQATCELDGEEGEVCSVCNDKRNVVMLEALGHDMSDNWATRTLATCTTEGEEFRGCAHTNCSYEEVRPISALEHLLGDWETTTPATCEAEGEEVRSCSRADCNHIGEWRQILQLTENCERECDVCGNNPCICSTSIRGNNSRDSRYGIVLESAVVSNFAKISVKTPESATVNISILDNLGSVVFETNGRNSDNFVWNLTNNTGRFVASGTYLVLVEATSVSGRRFTYSARIGVNR